MSLYLAIFALTLVVIGGCVAVNGGPKPEPRRGVSHNSWFHSPK